MMRKIFRSMSFPVNFVTFLAQNIRSTPPNFVDTVLRNPVKVQPTFFFLILSLKMYSSKILLYGFAPIIGNYLEFFGHSL